MEALHRQVLPFLLRRLKEDVLQDLPPKIIQDYYCELTPLQVARSNWTFKLVSKKTFPATIVPYLHLQSEFLLFVRVRVRVRVRVHWRLYLC